MNISKRALEIYFYATAVGMSVGMTVGAVLHLSQIQVSEKLIRPGDCVEFIGENEIVAPDGIFEVLYVKQGELLIDLNKTGYDFQFVSPRNARRVECQEAQHDKGNS